MNNKGRFLKKYRGNECLNCGVPLDVIDRYCHSCGQINTTKKLSFGDFFNEFFSSIFSYDSRLRHTIVALLFKPGKISKDYVEGKRIRYANPFRFYMSVSIIFFLITGLTTDLGDVNFNNGKNQFKGRKNGPIQFNFEKPDNPNAIAKEVQQTLAKNNIKLDSTTVKQIEEAASQIDSAITKEKTYQDVYYSEKSLDTSSFFNNIGLRWELYKEFFKQTEISNANQVLDSLKHTKTRYHRWIYDKSVQSQDMSGNINGIISFFLSKLPFIIFFMLPVFALAIWLIYIRRSFTYMEHLVFLFHTQTMFFVLLTFAVLLDSICFPSSQNDPFSGIALLVFLFYLYKAMRKFYQQGRFKTLVKFLILNQIFTILAVVGLTIGFLISFAVY